MLDYDLNVYQDSLHRRVRAAYLAGYSVLEKTYREGREKLEQDLKKPTDADDIELTSQIINYEDERWIEQRGALAAMALALLASLTKSFLDDEKGWMDKTHPPDPKGYAGKAQLFKQVTEYKARFGIDLEKLDGFETVREVELARHCCLHRGGVPNKDYKNKTKNRLLSEYGNIDMTREQLDLLIKELSRFGDLLSAEMREFRKRTMQPSTS